MLAYSDPNEHSVGQAARKHLIAAVSLAMELLSTGQIQTIEFCVSLGSRIGESADHARGCGDCILGAVHLQ